MAEDHEDPRQAVADALSSEDSAWHSGERVTLSDDEGEISWRPDLQHADGRLLLISGQLEQWIRRLRAACAAGKKIAIALDQNSLTIENLILAQEVGAQVLVVDFPEDGGDARISSHGSVADLVADAELSLREGGLQRLAEPHLDRALAETDTYRKGLMFEEVLLLLFSQVSYLKVIDHRYTNDTEEIDIVLGNRATGHMRGIFAGPLILVSGKNQKKASGAPDVRALRGNMSKRRKRCNFGILCAADRIADEAEMERDEATDDPAKAIALLRGSGIRALLASTQLDTDLEDELMTAVLPPRRGTASGP